MTAGSALWQRRQRTRPGLEPGGGSARKDTLWLPDVLQPGAAAAQLRSVPALPESSGERSGPGAGEEGSARLPGPQGRCRARPPSIDCALAAAESARADPFASAECVDLSERFELLERLGQGSTAVVYKARQRSSDSEVALKVLRVNDEEMLCTARQEYDLLSSIEHPYIIHALDFFTFSKGVVLVLDFFQGRTLEDAVLEAPGQHLQERVALRLFAALMQAVEHLHRSGIIHRDVKATNMLVNESLTDLKLVDFNTARRWRDGALTLTGTADYLPPEVLLGEPHTAASDIWASGLCLHWMLSGSLPLERRCFRSNADFGRAIQVDPAAQLCGPQWQHVSEACKDGLRRCLARDPQERLSASEVLQGAWLCEAADARAGA